MTAQEEIFLMGVEMVAILEKTTPERFEQYRADFMEQSAKRPEIRRFFEAVFETAEKRR